MKKNRLIDELHDLIAIYDAKLNDRQLELYLDALEDVDVDDLHAGIIELIKTSKWFPRVSEIRQAADQAHERRLSERVEDFRQRLVALRYELGPDHWDRRSPGEHIPAVIDWRSCERCGQSYAAEWGECPSCSALRLSCEMCGFEFIASESATPCPVCHAALIEHDEVSGMPGPAETVVQEPALAVLPF